LNELDPKVRYAKPARFLRPGGAIAVFDSQDALSDDGDGFFRAVLDDYEAVVPEWERTLPVPPALVAERVSPEIDASGVFAGDVTPLLGTLAVAGVQPRRT
jgi:hypothetical protein